MSDRFQASVLFGHQTALASAVGRMQAGVPFVPTAQELADLGNLAGGLNYWAGQATQSPPVGGPEGDIPYGDTSRHEFNASTTDVTSRSFRVPVMPSGGWPGPNGALLRLSIATFGGTDVMRRTCVSLTRGKLDDALFSQGKETPIAFRCGVELPEGALAYINTIALEEPPPGAARSSVSIIWPPLVYP